jgi:hypothetical protein
MKRTKDGSAYLDFVDAVVINRDFKARRWYYQLKGLADAAELREARKWFSEELLSDA